MVYVILTDTFTYCNLSKITLIVFSIDGVGVKVVWKYTKLMENAIKLLLPEKVGLKHRPLYKKA